MPTNQGSVGVLVKPSRNLVSQLLRKPHIVIVNSFAEINGWMNAGRISSEVRGGKLCLCGDAIAGRYETA